MDLHGTTLFVTGGCGLIGSTIVDDLVRDEKVVAVRVTHNLMRCTPLNIEYPMPSSPAIHWRSHLPKGAQHLDTSGHIYA